VVTRRLAEAEKLTMPAMTHGFYARSQSALEIRGRKVARLMRRLRVVAPWLEPSDESTARAYCELEFVGAHILAAVAKMGGPIMPPTEGLGPRRAKAGGRASDKLAQLAYARALGLTPAARMMIEGPDAYGVRSAGRDDRERQRSRREPQARARSGAV
jgi:hypothetical protein